MAIENRLEHSILELTGGGVVLGLPGGDEGAEEDERPSSPSASISRSSTLLVLAGNQQQHRFAMQAISPVVWAC